MEKHKILGENLIASTPAGTVIDLKVEHCITKKIKNYVKTLHHNWVNVVAQDKKGKVLLIKQWRAGTDSITTEVPGGKIDKGESACEAGLRELKEETGYGVSKESHIAYLGSVDANPAIQDNQMHFVYVTNVEKVGPTNFDEFENIEMTSADEDEIEAMLSKGDITHAYSVLALYKAFKG